MRKFALIGLVMLVAGLYAGPAKADDEGDSEKKVEVHGTVRGGFEYNDNYYDLQDDNNSGDVNDDSFSYWPYRAMVSVDAHLQRKVRAFMEFQYSSFYGNEDPVKGTTFPPDQIYNYGSGDVSYYQGFLEMDEIGGSGVNLRVGRQEHTYSTELFLGNNDFYSGTSFDGIRGWWDSDKSSLNAFYYKVQENNFGCFFGCGTGGSSVDTNVWGATYDYNLDKGGMVGGYFVSAQILAADEKVNTLGAHWTRMVNNNDDVQAGAFDWNIEYAVQSGDVGDPASPNPSIDLSGDVVEGWFGWNLATGDMRHRVHIGALRTSGDDPKTTNEIEDFESPFGDFHANNRFGDVDFFGPDSSAIGPHDITDVNLGYQMWCKGGQSFKVVYHKFKETEKNSFTGTPPPGVPGLDTDMGTEYDLEYWYPYSSNLTFEAMVGQFQPGKFFDDLLTFGGPAVKADTVTRFLVRGTVKF